MVEGATIQLPIEMLTHLSESVVEQAVALAEQNILHHDEFVQLNRTAKTPNNKRTLEDYLGGMSLRDFNYYWRRRVEAEPGLTIPKGEDNCCITVEKSNSILQNMQMKLEIGGDRT